MTRSELEAEIRDLGWEQVARKGNGEPWAMRPPGEWGIETEFCTICLDNDGTDNNIATLAEPGMPYFSVDYGAALAYAHHVREELDHAFLETEAIDKRLQRRTR